MRLQFKVIAGLSSVLALAGCASSTDRYPSLQIRSAERVTGVFEPMDGNPAPRVSPSASADLLEKLAQLRSEATVAHAGFLAAAPSARSLAERAQGSETGSDAWADAQVALGDLDSARSKAAIALGDLDILYVEATIDSQTRDEIEAARDAVVALISEEDIILAQLRAAVGG